MDKKGNLVWCDMEMTGLDANKDTILEIAIQVTDQELNVLSDGLNLIVHQDEPTLQAMGKWCHNQHRASGLWDQVIQSSITVEEAQEEALKLVRKYCYRGRSPLCGNSIGQDRLFLMKYMSKLNDYFHYRNIDVSSLKELAKRWYPDLPPYAKKSTHRAMDDILDSIGELEYYRKYIMLSSISSIENICNEENTKANTKPNQ